MPTILPYHGMGRTMIWISVIATLALGMRPPDSVAMLTSGGTRDT
jgi:hypothetical protein